jgi:hypothetical protein
VSADSSDFLISGRHFLPLYDRYFLAITTGDWPASVTDPKAFSPLLDILNGFVWRMWYDRQFTTATVLNWNYLTSYLALGEPTIAPTTYYLGACIPGRFCPNSAFHFQVDGWPTDLSDPTIQGYLTKFKHLPFVSGHAKQHQWILVNLHEADRRLLSFPFKPRSNNHWWPTKLRLLTRLLLPLSP